MLAWNTISCGEGEVAGRCCEVEAADGSRFSRVVDMCISLMDGGMI